MPVGPPPPTYAQPPPGPVPGVPPGYAPPMGNFPPGVAHARVVPLSAHQIRERGPAVVVLLSVVTCGLYTFYWLYSSTDQLRRCTSDASLKPGVDVLLALLTCGIWGWVVMYRNAQKIHAALVGRDPMHQDRSQMILMLCVASLAIGVTALISLYFSQEEMNLLARASSHQ